MSQPSRLTPSKVQPVAAIAVSSNKKRGRSPRRLFENEKLTAENDGETLFSDGELQHFSYFILFCKLIVHYLQGTMTKMMQAISL